MSATKIAASFRVSVMALVAEAGRSPVAGASAWLHFHAALIETRRAGNADPAFWDQPSRASKIVRQFYIQGNIFEPSNSGGVTPQSGIGRPGAGFLPPGVRRGPPKGRTAVGDVPKRLSAAAMKRALKTLIDSAAGYETGRR
jgi:hypothetical protein